jgi:hypothetical protein
VAGASGSDLSQQDAPQVTYADLVIGATNTQLTSAASPFGAAHVGNLINVTGGTGFTTGRYQVVSVAGAVATMDRAVGTAGSTGGGGRLGGALASPGVAQSAKALNNTVWIRSGTYPCGATPNVAGGRVDDTVGAQAGAVARWIGYNATRGDYGTPPVLTCGAASMAVFSIDAADVSVENLAFSNAAGGYAGSNGLNVNGARASAHRCTAAGFLNVGFFLNTSGQCVLSDCLADGAGVGFACYNTGTTLLRCTAINGVNTAGFSNLGGPGTAFNTFVGCVAAVRSGTSGAGWATAGSIYDQVLVNCLAYGCATGFDFSSSPHARLSNCVAYGNRAFGYGLHADAHLLACAGGANASGNLGGTAPAINLGFVVLTANPFTNAAGLDFGPNKAAGGGAPLRGAGVPSTLPGTITPSSPDIGAAQHADSGGGVSRARAVNGA